MSFEAAAILAKQKAQDGLSSIFSGLNQVAAAFKAGFSMTDDLFKQQSANRTDKPADSTIGKSSNPGNDL